VFEVAPHASGCRVEPRHLRVGCGANREPVWCQRG
jgi:hypothetical protein